MREKCNPDVPIAFERCVGRNKINLHLLIRYRSRAANLFRTTHPVYFDVVHHRFLSDTRVGANLEV